MAGNDGDQTPQADAVSDDAGDRRPIPGNAPRRKGQPITIDLAASAVRIEPPPEGSATETPALGVAQNKPLTVEVSEPDPKPGQSDTKKPGASSEPSASVHETLEPDVTTAPLQHPSETVSNDSKHRQGGIWGQMFAASLIGGAIGLAAAYGLAAIGAWPGGQSATLLGQVAALEARVAAAEAKVGPKGELASELDHLKSMPAIPGVTTTDVAKILDPFTAKTTAAIAHMDDIDKKIAGEQAIVRGESKAFQDALSTRMSGLETSVADINAQSRQLKSTVGTLQQDLAAAEKKAADQLAAVHSDFSTTLQALAARQTDLETRAAADLAVVRGTSQAGAERLAKVEQSISTLSADAQSTHKDLVEKSEAIGKLQARVQPIDEMQKAIDGLGARFGAVDDVKKILEAQTAKLGTADEAKKAADGVAASLWIIDQRIANLQARLTEVDALKAALAGDAREIAALQTRISPVEAKIGGLDGYARQGLEARKEAVAVVALANLKSAADSGRPFAGELNAAKAIVGTTLDLSSLDTFAGGLGSETKIIEDFDAAERRIAEATAAPIDGGGVLGTLMAHAVGTVKVLPVKAETGDTIAAQVSRISARLSAHDLSGALSSWQSLPDAAKEASIDWGKELRTHVEGTRAIAAILDATIAKLTSAAE